MQQLFREMAVNERVWNINTSFFAAAVHRSGRLNGHNNVWNMANTSLAAGIMHKSYEIFHTISAEGQCAIMHWPLRQGVNQLFLWTFCTEACWPSVSSCLPLFVDSVTYATAVQFPHHGAYLSLVDFFSCIGKSFLGFIIVARLLAACTVRLRSTYVSRYLAAKYVVRRDTTWNYNIYSW